MTVEHALPAVSSILNEKSTFQAIGYSTVIVKVMRQDGTERFFVLVGAWPYLASDITFLLIFFRMRAMN